MSQLFTKTQKQAPAGEDSINAKLLTRAGYIQKQAAGIYNYLPLGLRVVRKIENIIRQELNKIGGQEMLMPVLTQRESWEKTGRANLDILFKTENFVLNPTHEEVITPLMKKYISSYRDLPIAAYQIQNKFRNEPRAKSGLLRGREFLMKDMYSFHLDDKCQKDFYLRVRSAYHKIYDRLGIGDITIWTYASGGSFSKYSHEFQTLAEIGEDEIYLCTKCQVAVNKEIVPDPTGSGRSEQSSSRCPECSNEKLVKKNSIEVGNIFKLKTKFSQAFGLTYKDKSGKDQQIPMGCYGLGISRVMGALVEIFHDKGGIIWPESVAPFRIYLIPKKKRDFKNPEILVDDRKVSMGEKLVTADLLGIPYRLVAGEKLELKKRNQKKTKLVSKAWLKHFLTKTET